MFSNKFQLKKRTPENGIDRENFLSLLVDEYLNSTLYGKFCLISSNKLLSKEMYSASFICCALRAIIVIVLGLDKAISLGFSLHEMRPSPRINSSRLSFDL